MRVEGELYDDKHLLITVDGIEAFSFSVEKIDIDSRKWMLGLIQSQLRRVIERRESEAVAHLQGELKQLLGI
jgi:hypothetical protein